MKTLKELLIEFDACRPAIEWAEDKTIEQVLKECHRGDWLLWLANELQLPERKIIACSGHCVNTVRHLLKDEKSIKLLDMCMNFEDESISFEELKKARQAVYASKAASFAADSDYATYAAIYFDIDAANASATVYASYAASFAAASDFYADYATDYAAASDFYADYATDYAAKAASAAVYDDSVYVAAVARKENQLQTANIVRERLGQDIINKVNELLNN